MYYIFWVSIFLLIYCFIGYPVLLAIVQHYWPNKIRTENLTFKVSVLIAVWNEEDVIEAKINNLLGQHYPAHQLEIIIGSDGSTDRTNAIVRSFDPKRVKLVESERRAGKTSMLNRLIPLAQGDIIVFNDARQMLNDTAIQSLVSHFADHRVGCVSGELIFNDAEGGTAKGINLYWKYEKFMRFCEAHIHSMLGATGALYAIRKELYREVPYNVVLDDMYIPLSIIEQGYRAIFDKGAIAFDNPADSPQEEHRRKARTLFGNYQIFGLFLHMFNPLTSPIAIQLFSHKFLRVIAPFLMILALFSNIFLITIHPFYAWILVFQITFYVMALLGSLLRDKKYGIFVPINKCCYIPYVFCLMNFSAIIGFYRFMTAKQEITWQKARKSSSH